MAIPTRGLVRSLALASCVVALARAGPSPLEWSRRLAVSEMDRRGAALSRGGSPGARWDYTSGLFAHSLIELGNATGDKSFSRHGGEMIGSFVNDDGTIATYRPEDNNLDMVLPGRALLSLWRETRDPQYRIALEILRGQLASQPRTSEGGFWHKRRYPWQMWLDGIYMASPFLAAYGKTFGDAPAADEAARQILLMDRHAYDPATGLYFHGWDEKREQPWADKTTGLSPCVWGRGAGWYAMALVDCLDTLPPDHPHTAGVIAILRKFAAGIIRQQDKDSGLWWQVPGQAAREGNYLETTASSMFVYALAKAINRGYLDRETYLAPVSKGYAALVRDRLRAGDNGALHLTGCCEVAGLGAASAKGRPRDGSFGYYISEPVIEDDLKGVGPLILAGIEMEKLAGATTPGWQHIGRVLTGIRMPEFPDRDFAITAYGATPGTDASAALRAAIDACHHAGGGRVRVPDGEWLTGPVRLKSGVNLHLEKGSVLKFLTDPGLYPPVATRWEGMECMNHSALVSARDEDNIAITGKGTLDGQATAQSWWAWCDRENGKPAKQDAARRRLCDMAEEGVPAAQRVFGAGTFLRPNFIQFIQCENILIEGVTILRSPMWCIHPVLCNNVTVRKTVVSSHGPNNDGCDPESCRNVLIEECTFDTGDDCIAIKSGRNGDGRRINRPSADIVIRRCVMKDGHGGVVLGSEISGGARNIFIEDCAMDSPALRRALRIKSNAARGGTIEDVFMRRVRIGRVTEAALAIDLLYGEGERGAYPPVVRNIVLEHITSSGSPRVLFIRGFEGAVIEGIVLRDSEFSATTTPDVIEHAGSILMENVSIPSNN